ncbi:MAG: FlgD immunoglobulin-like domain containing protein [candidate division WOR-3 bacterium]
MKLYKISLFLTIFVFLFAGETSLTPSEQPAENFDFTNEVLVPKLSPVPPSPVEKAIPYTIEWRIALPDTYHVGLTPVNDTILWVSEGASSTTSPDYMEVYVYNLRTRTLIDSFNQPAGITDRWGWRDMTCRGDTVFASWRTAVNVIHVPTRTVVRSFTPGTGLSCHRALGSDPLDSLISLNFSTPFWKFYKDTPYNPHSYSNIDTSYGVGYDNHGFLWMSVQTGASQGKIAKFSYPVLTKLDQQVIPEITGIAGGCEMWRDTFLLYLNQGTPDEVVCLRLYFPPPTGLDVGVDAIRRPTQLVDPNSVIAPLARIKNFGTNSVSNIPVYCWIDSAGTRIYNQNLTYTGTLAPNETALVSFPNWLVGPAGASYQVKMFTDLPNDSNRANDTLRQTTFSFLVRDTLIAPWYQVIPTVDGEIQPTEWADALKWDISDVLNMQGSGARPPGSVFLYVKHDSNNVYWALDFVAKATREDYDQFGCYLDENYNRVWTTDSSEGNHWFVWLTRDTVVYRALIGTGNIPSAYWTRWLTGNGISRASTASGHLQFEAVVAKGTQKWNYTINPEEDTVGFYVYVSAAPGSVYWGTWPTTMPGANWNNAATYGTLIFSRQQVEIKEGKGITKTEIKINNPLRMPLILKGVKGLSIYDATGKVVKEINEAKDGNLVWDGKDRNGNSISNGIYFLKMKLDNGSQTTKAIILH